MRIRLKGLLLDTEKFEYFLFDTLERRLENIQKSNYSEQTKERYTKQAKEEGALLSCFAGGEDALTVTGKDAERLWELISNSAEVSAG